MAVRVAIYQLLNNRRSIMVAAAMARGIIKAGDTVRIHPAAAITAPDGDIAVFYGFDRSLRHVFEVYRAYNRPVVLIDLGYWDRRKPGPLDGYHKFAVNNRHPTAYFQAKKHDNSRVSLFNLVFGNQKKGDFILLAGMGDKSAEAEGFAPEEWERHAVSRLRDVTTRTIVYRPKPSWKTAAPIPGTIWGGADVFHDIDPLLKDCRAVVTHHSNAAIEAIIAGVPAYCEAGVAMPMACTDISQIETAQIFGDRQQWVNDISYTQFNRAEMMVGTPWMHLKNEGLIP